MRRLLEHGLGATRAEVSLHGGPIARAILDRLVRDGEALERSEGRYTLTRYNPDPERLAREIAERRAKRERAEQERIERERLARERAEQEARRAQEKALAADELRAAQVNLGAYRIDERPLVLAERLAAMQEGRS